MGNCAAASSEPINPDYVDLTHFELLKVVGKGGFGKVNAITQLSSQELLALKRIEKSRIIKSKSHLNMVWTERKIMSIVRSPFLCHLRYAFESDTELFLVMPFLQGGDLRFHLKERGRMREETAKFYAAQIVLGLEELHSHWIVYRDLKPENVLLDAKGNIQITDFGLAFMLKDDDKRRTRGQAGTRGYMAPETMGVRGYGLSVDYFSLGVMLYELLHGVRPWKNIDTSMAMMGLEGEIDPLAAVRNHKKDLERELEEAVRGMGAKKESVNGHKREPSHTPEEEDDDDKPDVIRFSSRLTEDAKSLLLSLLEFNPNKRLGCLPQQMSNETPQLGWSYVKSHPWFANIDWAAMESGNITAPFMPDITHANCTPDADLADQLLDKKPKRIRDDEQRVFEGWSWNTKINKDEPAAATVALTDADGGKLAGEPKRARDKDVEGDGYSARGRKVRGGVGPDDDDEEGEKIDVGDEEVRSLEVRKDEVENEYEEKSFDDGTITAVSVSEQLPHNDSNNSSSMTADDRREEKMDTLPPLNSSFLPIPSSTATHSSMHASTTSHASLSLSAPEPSNSSSAYSTSPPRTPPIPLVITAAETADPINTAASALPAASASPIVGDQQTATTPIHLPVSPLSPPSHHRNSSSTSSASSASTSSAHLLPSASSSASIHLAFTGTPLTSLPGSSRPSITSNSTHLPSSSHTTHRQSHSTGQLSLPREKDDPLMPTAVDGGAAGGLLVPAVNVLSVERKERRSTLKEKRELKPIIAAEHARTSSTPSIVPAAVM